MPLMKSLLKKLTGKIEQPAPSPEKSEFPVCTVYTKTLGPHFPLEVIALNPAGVTVMSTHEIFVTGEYVALKMVFPKMTVSMPGRVTHFEIEDSSVHYKYFIEFRRS